jgi:hypothetical protein
VNRSRRKPIPYLPAPSRMKNLRIVVEYEQTFNEFYGHLASVDIPTVPNGGESYQSLLVQIDQAKLIEMSAEVLLHTIQTGAFNATDHQSHGIGYGDIANTARQPEVRATLYTHGSFEHTENDPVFYLPDISPTETYHLRTLFDAMIEVLNGYFGDTMRLPDHGEDDVMLWRILLATSLTTAKAISFAGREHGISEAALMNYSIKNIFPYDDDRNTFLYELEGV